MTTPLALSLEVASLRCVRSWPGYFLVRSYRAHECLALIGARSQAHLREVLTDILTTTSMPAEVIVSRHHNGQPPTPITALEVDGANLAFMPPEPSGEGTPEELERTEFHYERIVKKELDAIEAQLVKHQDVRFARGFLESLLLLRRYRPNWIPDSVQLIPDERVGAELERTMLALQRGFELIDSDWKRALELEAARKNGESIDEAELLDLTLVYVQTTHPRTGEITYDYEDTTAGARHKRWDELCATAYALANRKAPTPVMWHKICEPWFAQGTSAEQTPLLETPELVTAGSDRRVWK